MANAKENTTLASNSKTMETTTNKFKKLQLKYKQSHVTRGNKCPVCRKKFSFRQNLLRHTNQYHRNVKSFKCPHCPLLFTNGQSLSRHMKTHEHIFNIKHVCEYCSKNFKSICHLYQHLMLHIVENGMWEKTFDDNDSYPNSTSDQNAKSTKWSKHTCANVHLNNEKKYFCGICSKAFKSNYLLNNHLSVHSEERPYSCTLCNVAYKNKNSLTHHNIKNHSVQNNKKYICELCSKSFVVPYELKIHFISHGKERAYKCPMCNKDYKYKQNMLQHKKTHLKHKCKICFLAFEDRSSLDSHFKKKHLEEIPFSNVECSLNSCDKTEKLTKNIETSNNEHFRDVSHDNHPSLNKYQERNKQRIHTKNGSQSSNQIETITEANQIKYPISINDKEDLTSSSPHLISNDEKCVCKVCNKSFSQQGSLFRHLRTVHSEERVYSCSLCNKSFKRNTHLKMHCKTHLNSDSKTSDHEDLKTIKVNKNKEIKKYLEKVNDIGIHIVESSYDECSSNSYNKTKKPIKALKLSKDCNYSKDIYQQDDKHFLNKNQEECEMDFIKIPENSKEIYTVNGANCLNKNQESVYEISLIEIPKESEHRKDIYHHIDHKNQVKNTNFKIKVPKVSEDHFESFLKKDDEEVVSFTETKSEEVYHHYGPSFINKNQDKEIFNFQTTHNNLEPFAADNTLDSNQFDKEVIKADFGETNALSKGFVKYLEIKQDNFGNQINEVSKIKEEFPNDNGFSDDFGFNSVLEISETEFIYDESIVSSAKRKEKNTNTYDSSQENENWNTCDSQNELQVFSKNNYTTKLKLRYKLLKGKCTVCNKIFDCPKDYVEHGLEFHPNPEVFKSANTHEITPTLPENLPIKFSCHLCKISFQNLSSLEKHLREHTPNVNVKNHQKKHFETASRISDIETSISKDDKSKNTTPTPSNAKNHSNLTSTTNNVIDTEDTLHKYVQSRQRIHLARKSKDLKCTNDSSPPTKGKVAQFLIPTIKLNDATYDNQCLSKNFKSKVKKSFTPNEMTLKKDEDEFISLINTADIKEEFIDGY